MLPAPVASDAVDLHWDRSDHLVIVVGQGWYTPWSEGFPAPEAGEPVPAASFWIFNMGHPDRCAGAHLRLAADVV